jgi:hypothetical protein
MTEANKGRASVLLKKDTRGETSLVAIRTDAQAANTPT